uniref:WD repeat-containing protein 82 n=1 Tax=Panagrolaimus davidi TaxID=227884 RepID=A0A914QNK4_9BILA
MKIIDMALSPQRELLLTCSNDNSFRVFDIRVNDCTHKMDCGTPPLVAIDSDGYVIALALDSKEIKMYDFRNMGNGPFQTFPFEDPSDRKWIKIKFSPLGTQIMINTNTPTVMLLEAYSANYNHVLNTTVFPGACQEVKGNFFSDYSMDEKYLFIGGPNGVVSVFETKDGKKCAELRSKHRGHVIHTAFNPVYRIMATASDELHLWS